LFLGGGKEPERRRAGKEDQNNQKSIAIFYGMQMHGHWTSLITALENLESMLPLQILVLPTLQILSIPS
jgi:hypothetical protein